MKYFFLKIGYYSEEAMRSKFIEYEPAIDTETRKLYMHMFKNINMGKNSVKFFLKKVNKDSFGRFITPRYDLMIKQKKRKVQIPSFIINEIPNLYAKLKEDEDAGSSIEVA
jgi:hypothetical protein